MAIDLQILDNEPTARLWLEWLFDYCLDRHQVQGGGD